MNLAQDGSARHVKTAILVRQRKKDSLLFTECARKLKQFGCECLNGFLGLLEPHALKLRMNTA
eukprot:4363285-Amphidinium_carterae.1